jgi:hypothetical protein
MTFEERRARLRAHRNNIRRYRQLLGADLTDFERDFIERRVREEDQAIRILSCSGMDGFEVKKVGPLRRSRKRLHLST